MQEEEKRIRSFILVAIKSISITCSFSSMFWPSASSSANFLQNSGKMNDQNLLPLNTSIDPSNKIKQQTISATLQEQKIIGIIGGASWESTQLYYQLINKAVREQLGGLNSAKLLIYSMNYAPIVSLEQQENWKEVGNLIAGIAKILEEGGADFIILCCNTLHKATPFIEAAIKIPFLHIADAAARVLVDAHIHRVGLLGTRFTMEDGFYAERLGQFGLTVFTPPSSERMRLDAIIYNQLCQGKVSPESKAEIISMIQGLKTQGAQAILLGCTELGMLIEQDDSVIPVYDTTLLHAQEAVRTSLIPE